jgi:hypothetical protein
MHRKFLPSDFIAVVALPTGLRPYIFSGGIWTPGTLKTWGASGNAQICISADGSRGLASTGARIMPYTVASGVITIGTAITGIGAPAGVSISPTNVNDALVADNGNHYVYPMTYSSSWSLGSPLSVGSGPNEVKIGATGIDALVACMSTNYGAYPLVKTTGWAVGTRIATGDARGVGMGPDGMRAIIVNQYSGGDVPLSLSAPGGTWSVSGATSSGGSFSASLWQDNLHAILCGYGSNYTNVAAYSAGTYTGIGHLNLGWNGYCVQWAPDNAHGLIIGAAGTFPLTWDGAHLAKGTVLDATVGYGISDIVNYYG